MFGFLKSSECLVPCRVLLGRSHVKAVAENRRTEIEHFLQVLKDTKEEVAHVRTKTNIDLFLTLIALITFEDLLLAKHLLI